MYKLFINGFFYGLYNTVEEAVSDAKEEYPYSSYVVKDGNGNIISEHEAR